MVERVEGLATENEWKTGVQGDQFRFERQLRDFGTISGEVLDSHFTRRAASPVLSSGRRSGIKAWKLTEEDWRNRAKWDVY